MITFELITRVKPYIKVSTRSRISISVAQIIKIEDDLKFERIYKTK